MRFPAARRTVIAILLLTLVLVLPPAVTSGAEGTAAGPTSRDKCPVCGMFVAKYKDFIGRIGFPDGSAVFFDGAKDMFKYIFDVPRYTPNRKASDMVSIQVTDYYSLALIDARSAFYVVGSNVYGPMGKELIPFAGEGDAREFMVDHAGKEILRFDDVKPELVKALD